MANGSMRRHNQCASKGFAMASIRLNAFNLVTLTDKAISLLEKRLTELDRTRGQWMEEDRRIKRQITTIQHIHQIAKFNELLPEGSLQAITLSADEVEVLRFALNPETAE